MIFNIIIIFAVLQLAYNLLFKPKYNNLSCGLFGAAADDVSRINIDKLKILGIYNDIRGGHSCGLAIDGDLVVGTGSQKLFKDFIATNNIVAPSVLPVILGHTRMATGGSHTEWNAHPFGFGDNKGYYHFMGAHNGTLYNHVELAKKYDIDIKVEYPLTTTTIGERVKIDSEILLEIIYKNANFKVLEEYNGAAALAMYNTKKRNNLYLYHGASKKYSSDKELTEERPMFVLQLEPGLLYYSSIKESLEAINDTDGFIQQIEHNVVFEIKNGDFTNAKQIKINRTNEGVTQSKFTNTTYNNYSDYEYIGYGSGGQEYDHETRKWIKPSKNKHKNGKSNQTTLPMTVPTGQITAPNKKFNLNSLTDHQEYYETCFPKEVESSIYFENLRFYKNKELLDGVYVLDKSMNLIHVTSYMSAFSYYFDKLHESTGIGDLKNTILFFFVKGIRLLSKDDYDVCKDNYANWDANKLSHMSVYPVRNIALASSKSYFRGNEAAIQFLPLFGKDIIKMRNGFSFEISKKDIEFEKNRKFYLEEDLNILDLVIENNEVPKEEPIISAKVDDSTAIELYSENIVATVEYCIEDSDDTIEDVATANKVKSVLGEIKEFIVNKLKF